MKRRDSDILIKEFGADSLVAELRRFWKKNPDPYEALFRKRFLNANTHPLSSFGWNWGAFIFGNLWFFYRGLYGVAFLMFLFCFVAVINGFPAIVIALHVVAALYSKAEYVAYSLKHIQIARKEGLQSEGLQDYYDRYGGASVNRAIVPATILFLFAAWWIARIIFIAM